MRLGGSGQGGGARAELEGARGWTSKAHLVVAGTARGRGLGAGGGGGCSVVRD